jgi:hypothetical protein
MSNRAYGVSDLHMSQDGRIVIFVSGKRPQESEPIVDKWKKIVSADAVKCDREIHKHIDCKITDGESLTFVCYDHNVSVRWIG